MARTNGLSALGVVALAGLTIAPGAHAAVKVGVKEGNFTGVVTRETTLRVEGGSDITNTVIRPGVDNGSGTWILTSGDPGSPNFRGFVPGTRCDGDNAVDANSIPASFAVATCDRTDDISITLGQFPDRLAFPGADAAGAARGDAGNRPVTVSSGKGDDRITTEGNVLVTGRWIVNLGPGDDSYTGSWGNDSVDAGTGIDAVATLGGNDTIKLGDGNDPVNPGPGQDSVDAGAGTDTVFAGFEDERFDLDAYDGGPGNFDVISYSGRTTPVFVLKSASTGGRLGKSEDKIANFERAVGGSGNDSLLGLSGTGNEGNDVLTGGNGKDSINGGPGVDTMRGFDGDDLLLAKDGELDAKIECGRGSDDHAIVDLRDVNVSEDCERIDRRAVDEEPATVIASAAPRLRGATLAIVVRCPRSVLRGGGCAGRLSAALARGGARAPKATSYELRAGEGQTVIVTLTDAEAQRVRAAGTAVTVTSSERGRRGAETVLRKFTVRLGER